MICVFFYIIYIYIWCIYIYMYICICLYYHEYYYFTWYYEHREWYIGAMIENWWNVCKLNILYVMRSLVHHIIDILVYIILYVQPFNISYTYIYIYIYMFRLASMSATPVWGPRHCPPESLVHPGGRNRGGFYLDNQKTPGLNLKVPRSLCISAINVAVLEIEVCGYSEFIFAMNFIPPG